MKFFSYIFNVLKKPILSEKIGIPILVPEHCEQAWHMYYLLMPSLEARTEFIARLKEKGVTAVFHYLPLNKSAYALQMADSGWRRTDCPVTEDVSDRIVRLPFYTSMTEEEQGRVLEEIISGCFK